MGSVQIKQCFSADVIEEREEEFEKQTKRKIRLIENKLSEQDSPQSPETQYLGVGSYYDSSNMNSFYKEHQIGPFLLPVDVERSSSYKMKMQKWKKLLEYAPKQRDSLKCSKCEHHNPFEDFIFQKEQKEQQNYSMNSDQLYNEYYETTIENPVVAEHSHQKDGSFDVPAFQKTYKFVNDKLDTAIISYNIMDKKGFKLSLLEGPPNMRLRWSCWKTSLLIKERNIDLEYYLSLDSHPNTEETIIKDIRRTISWHKFFQCILQEQTFGHEQLFRLLKGLGNRFPKLGYCQGMNFLAGFLLLVSGGAEHQTFACLFSLMENPKFMLYHIYCDQLPFLVFIEQLTLTMMTNFFPQLTNHLAEIDLHQSLWITKFYLSLFLYSFNIKTCLRLWDYIFSTNIFGAVSLILAFVEINYEFLMGVDQCDFMGWFQTLDQEDQDVKSMIRLAKEKYSVSKDFVAQQAKKVVNSCSFVKILQKFNDKKTFKILYRNLIEEDNII